MWPGNTAIGIKKNTITYKEQAGIGLIVLKMW